MGLGRRLGMEVSGRRKVPVQVCRGSRRCSQPGLPRLATPNQTRTHGGNLTLCKDFACQYIYECICILVVIFKVFGIASGIGLTKLNQKTSAVVILCQLCRRLSVLVSSQEIRREGQQSHLMFASIPENESKASTHFTCPPHAAECSGVSPILFVAFAAGFFAKRAFTTSVCPPRGGGQEQGIPRAAQ